MSQNLEIEAIHQQIQIESAFVERLLEQQRRVLVGQDYLIGRLVLGLLSGGHLLLEGMPGLAKTLAIKTLARCVDAGFQRIQFTPDLLPADILGTLVYNPADHQFSVRKGPIFSNFILADEINRAPAKVQSALLEAMQEKQVTIGRERFPLEEPFLVLATQNPIEQEGTYPLPEAQTDRFMMKIIVSYPGFEEEREIVRRNLSGAIDQVVEPVVHPDDILRARRAALKIYMDERIERYLLQLVFATRNPAVCGLKDLAGYFQHGASPRASIYLALASKVYAFMQRRGFVIPDDVQQVCRDVLRHRIGLSYEAEAEDIHQDELITHILSKVEVP
ncbi:MAG: AAA family ATPase [Saprospiraceae bacterium]|jgi:MoxR-like ATPase|nr:AAA family ATPase [Saprospiraceae bacterium]MBP9208821.1 AAA family ATPase [Saprospiraceae bacterium]